MLIDLLSTDNYVSYNVKLANVLGLHQAIYISELLNINDKAIRKNKVTDSIYFVLDREYMQSRTTFTVEEQEEIEKSLLNISVLKKEDESMALDVTMLTSIIMSEDESLIANIENLSKLKNKKPKATKKEKITEALKDQIVTTNEELKVAYRDWIDSVVQKQGWMSAKSVSVGQRIVDEFSNHDLDKALKLIEIATINAYRDMQWAVDNYTRNYKMTYKEVKTTVSKDVKLSSEVF